MSKIAIVTDSTAYIPKERREELGVTMVPLNVVFGEESYAEEVEISTSQFYEKMKSSEELPKTSQPAVGLFAETFERLQNEGYDAIITIHLSSGISGTYQTAITAAGMVDGIEVFGFDSEISCMIQGYYVIEAAEMAEAGKSVDEIFTRLNQMKESMRAYFMVDDLNHLHRGGRLNGAQLVVGSLLKIKPVLHFENKVIVPYEKVRTAKKALSRIYSLLDEDASTGAPIRATVIHANRPDEAKEIETELENKYDNVDIEISHFGPVIGTHLGEGSLGIGWYKK
ncbi:DegV family protein [Desertibacillus haloalkaliphilus]|uniref:DegV family protein n=1 Tax=Desertibacillus haloalkaliphilus TaxID=1328930 RepID=UPI001C262486|nr:DegV family protein [Desertibacillus haloalkaliphilus]MBU8905981.1 DegV family protein [Desertibacillus haloalkaliphilus]